jgi:hypothetical protein
MRLHGNKKAILTDLGKLLLRDDKHEKVRLWQKATSISPDTMRREGLEIANL